ncbi:MAG TPA: sulfate adenylyltransferase subunit CysN [Allosphingosinicella sp.]|jgi:bifunctional enzyme CysN/CysC|nr:sulfate adenylyltransferase subunit CysN [Allosphingosinicella sp.]
MATALRNLAPADAARIEIEAFLEANQKKSLLRFITCGSVDDGKSTLIGRLLYDSKLLFDDQLAALHSDSRKAGIAGDGLDLASLVDGLAAEREQGITIDVAYRFFATARRKFIVADTPGHEQYTRNMVTGASTADLAVILIDARQGVLTQTRRHSFLCRLLGIRSLVLAVNKMDLVGYDRARFDEVVEDYDAFAREAGIESFTAIPLSGLNGENVTRRSDAMPWYDGPSLLEHLETVEVAPRRAAEAPFRMAVQWVNRPDQNFRGYAGRIASGRVRVGDEVAILPAGTRSTIARIVTFDGDLAEAGAGRSVTLTFADQVDCSRGDLIASPDGAAEPASRLAATLVWMAEEALVPHRTYWLKIGTSTVSASLGAPGAVIDVNSMAERPAATFGLNDIGRVEIDLDRPVPAVRYEENRRLGGFILIDKLTHETVAAGLVEHVSAGSGRRVGAPRSEAGEILWIGGSGTTDRAACAARVAARLKVGGRNVFLLDDEALDGLIAGLGNDEVARAETVRRAREVALLMSRAGVDVVLEIDARSDEAWPGRLIDPSQAEREGADQWVI